MSTATSAIYTYRSETIYRPWYPWNYGDYGSGWPQYVGVPSNPDFVSPLGTGLRLNPYYGGQDEYWAGNDQDTLDWILLQVDNFFSQIAYETVPPPAGFIFVGDPVPGDPEWADFGYHLIAHGNASYGRIMYWFVCEYKIPILRQIIKPAIMIAPVVTGVLLAGLALLATGAASGITSSGANVPARRRRKS